MHQNPLSSVESVDIIEKTVYEYLKPFGFRKFGRTLHRFVDVDMSQVVNFQNGCPAKGIRDVLWINLGIRIPECVERKFVISGPLKKYYHEYECNIRTRLGILVDGTDTVYDLKNDPEKIGSDIVERMRDYAMPVFAALNSRDAVLKDRAKYDRMNHLILLEKAMILGRKGEYAAATQSFNIYYQNVLTEYEHDILYGKKIYLKKGESVVYRNARTGKTDTIRADRDGYVITYNANRAHLTYIEKLAKELGILLSTP